MPNNRLMVAGMALTALLSLSGCQEPNTQVVDASCTLFRMIYPSSEDALSKPTASAILAHDEKFTAHCGAAK